MVQVCHKTYEALLDSRSIIASISTKVVQELNLPIRKAPSIQILFGDHSRVYHSNQQVDCFFSLAQHSFAHSFYVFPRQLFSITMGCDWFIHSKAQLRFDSCQLILPNIASLPILTQIQHNFMKVNSQISLETHEDRLRDIRKLLIHFPKLFQGSTKTSQITLPVYHSINTGNAQPVYVTSRRRSPLEHSRISQAILEMFEKGIIEPSASNWVSEPHLVKKR